MRRLPYRSGEELRESTALLSFCRPCLHSSYQWLDDLREIARPVRVKNQREVTQASRKLEPGTSMGRFKWCDRRHAGPVLLELHFQVTDIYPFSLNFQQHYDRVVPHDRYRPMTKLQRSIRLADRLRHFFQLERSFLDGAEVGAKVQEDVVTAGRFTTNRLREPLILREPFFQLGRSR